MNNVVLVGATDGIGLALAREYLARGARVAIVGRDPRKLEAVRAELEGSLPGRLLAVVACDVGALARIGPAFDEAVEALGDLDLLIYCAGMLGRAATVDERLELAEAALDVNLLGAIHFLERAAAYLEPLGRGRLAAIGSMAGVRGRKGDPVYGASKAGLHAYLEGLRHRLHGSGVGVTTVKPGFVQTRLLKDQGRRFPPAVTAASAARTIANGLERGRDGFFVPWWWALVAWALRALPTGLYKRVALP